MSRRGRRRFCNYEKVFDSGGGKFFWIRLMFTVFSCKFEVPFPWPRIHEFFNPFQLQYSQLSKTHTPYEFTSLVQSVTTQECPKQEKREVIHTNYTVSRWPLSQNPSSNVALVIIKIFIAVPSLPALFNVRGGTFLSLYLEILDFLGNLLIITDWYNLKIQRTLFFHVFLVKYS